MKIAILPNNEAIGKVGADLLASMLKEKPDAVIGLATGSSPLPFYGELIERYKAGEISFAECKAFTLDEYIGLDPNHPESYVQFIHREFVDHVDFPEGVVKTPDAQVDDLQGSAAAYDASIAEAGGVDFQILGIGSDGHIAFNEPGDSLASRTHIVYLHDQTRRDNARFFDGDINQVPRKAISQGLGTILEARKIVLFAQGKGKAQAIRELVEGGISARWPATVLQMHPEVYVIADEDAASELELASSYREDWDNFASANL
jgi:glucosamine-6-phosphate deaminase